MLFPGVLGFWGTKIASSSSNLLRLKLLSKVLIHQTPSQRSIHHGRQNLCNHGYSASNIANIAIQLMIQPLLSSLHAIWLKDGKQSLRSFLGIEQSSTANSGCLSRNSLRVTHVFHVSYKNSQYTALWWKSSPSARGSGYAVKLTNLIIIKVTDLRKSIETCIENDYSLRQGIAPKGIKVSSSK